MTPTRHDPQQDVQDRWQFRALALLLLWAPLPLGSNRNWALGVLGVGVAGLLVVSWLGLLKRGRSPLAYLAPAAVPLVALLAYAALVAAQALGGLQGVALFEGARLGTADRHQTLHYLLASLTYTALFATVLLQVRTPGRIRTLALVLVASGLVQALLAIVLLSVGAQYQFLYQDIRHGTQATGTFINRNHLAGYMYLCLSVGIGLLLGSLNDNDPAPRRWQDHAVNLLKFMLSPRMALRVLLVVMVIALVLTRSRMGNMAFFSTLIFIGVVVAINTPALRRKALLMVVSLVLVDIVVVGQWVGLDRVMQRIEGTALQMEDARTEETVEARIEPARHILPMIEQQPWFGHGGGSYYTAFPQFKTRAMLLHLYYFDHAHNDYAEIAADTGLLGLALLAVVVLASVWRVRALLSPRQPSQSRGVAFAALMAMSCIVLHSVVDFNLQIPANALTFTAILALLWATPMRRRRRGGAPGEPPAPVALATVQPETALAGQR